MVRMSHSLFIRLSPKGHRAGFSKDLLTAHLRREQEVQALLREAQTLLPLNRGTRSQVANTLKPQTELGE